MSYEEQINKWAAKKFNINVNLISKVNITPETRREGYCETCEYSYAVIKVSIYGKEMDKYNYPKCLFTKDIEDVSFVNLLKEIMEA